MEEDRNIKTIESKFKVGQIAYHVIDGLVKVDKITDTGFVYSYAYKNDKVHVLHDGRWSSNDLNPTVITLEEARARGFYVPKRKETRTIKSYAAFLPTGEAIICASLRAAKSYEDKVFIVEMTGSYEVEIEEN